MQRQWKNINQKKQHDAHQITEIMKKLKIFGTFHSLRSTLKKKRNVTSEHLKKLIFEKDIAIMVQQTNKFQISRFT